MWRTPVGAAIRPPEDQTNRPLVGMNAGEGLLVVPAGSLVVGYSPAPLQVVTFDELSNSESAANWPVSKRAHRMGQRRWYLSGPWGLFTANSISFNGPWLTSASFAFLSPRRLQQLDLYNGGTSASTVSLSCDGQSTVTTVMSPGQLATLKTSWIADCSTVTVASSNGWDTNFDKLVVD